MGQANGGNWSATGVSSFIPGLIFVFRYINDLVELAVQIWCVQALHTPWTIRGDGFLKSRIFEYISAWTILIIGKPIQTVSAGFRYSGTETILN